MPGNSPADFSVVTDLNAFSAHLKGGVVAIGNFDGVHRGHRAVLGEALELGKRLKCPVYAMTFEPHPRTVFNSDHPVFRLTPFDAKCEILKDCDLNGVLMLPFTREFAGVEAQDFVRDILIERLAISHAVTGYDFHFGKARKGTPDFLRQAGDNHGFGVSIVSPENDEGAEIISSSRIRQALSDGEIPLANGLLGYRWFFDAHVQHGDKRGRDLGYPTANLSLGVGCPLKHGIYAVKARVDDELVDGVASFGRRPTFDNGSPLFEVHLFDFKQDLYGKMLRIHLVSYLRGEEKFATVEALIEQMDQDSEEARSALASMQPISALDLQLTQVT
ncbi:bifunctional riboflavin kinase/FAD synthetase [Roseibium polysiphoniae]|uniref:Riboflavin biosynthesis protein n=1 Tax=Roseibium polysiphoniae TaxID=2571221 RepID=A0ABR9CDU1_9HYPH|nr:bifunctional riboflavin kinase/FAD synthetase [Roseibium polysiphoniae]MBD8878054.1 bifunctional riboflavin kinase/FAD synthetase [Roseibium polysiphoniae]